MKEVIDVLVFLVQLSILGFLFFKTMPFLVGSGKRELPDSKLKSVRSGITGEEYYLGIKTNDSLPSPVRCEADVLEIARLREQKAVLETVLEENGISLPSDAPKRYEAYLWRDKTIEDI